MSYYEIENTKSGLILGVYEGDTGDEAIRAMLADGGDGGDPDAGLAPGEPGPDLVAREVAVDDDDIRALRSEAVSAGDSEQVASCDLALAGDADARLDCVQGHRLRASGVSLMRGADQKREKVIVDRAGRIDAAATMTAGGLASRDTSDRLVAMARAARAQYAAMSPEEQAAMCAGRKDR